MKVDASELPHVCKLLSRNSWRELHLGLKVQCDITTSVRLLWRGSSLTDAEGGKDKAENIVGRCKTGEAIEGFKAGMQIHQEHLVGE